MNSLRTLAGLISLGGLLLASCSQPVTPLTPVPISTPTVQATVTPSEPTTSPAATEAAAKPSSSPQVLKANTDTSGGSPSPNKGEATTIPDKVVRKKTSSCITGEWQVGDMSSYIASVLPIEMHLTGELQFKGTSGTMHYTFADDGQVTLKADSYTFHFVVAVSEIPDLPLEITLNGSSSGSYTADDNFLNLSAEAPADLKVTVKVAGEAMMENARVANLVPMGGPGDQSYPYLCEGNTLRILSPVPTALPITLTRVIP